MLGMSRFVMGAELSLCIGTAMAGEPGVRHPFNAEQAKDLPKGRNPVRLSGYGDAAEAKALIREAMGRFADRAGQGGQKPAR